MGESKNEKFKRLAVARTNKIIDMIHLLGNLSNPYIYDYSREEVDKIFSAIETELSEARKKYSFETKRESDKFTL